MDPGLENVGTTTDESGAPADRPSRSAVTTRTGDVGEGSFRHRRSFFSSSAVGWARGCEGKCFRTAEAARWWSSCGEVRIELLGKLEETGTGGNARLRGLQGVHVLDDVKIQ